MFSYSRMRNIFNSNRITSTGFLESFSLISGIFSGNTCAEKQLQQRRAFQSLVLPMLQQDGSFVESRVNTYRRLLEEHLDRGNVEKHLAELKNLIPLDANSAVSVLTGDEPAKVRKSAELLLALAAALDENVSGDTDIFRIVSSMGIPENEIKSLHTRFAEEHRKKRLIRSGKGIVAALVIIAVFILTAKLLQSVIFGLLLGCILLPLEKFFERRLRRKSGIIYICTAASGMLLAPLRKLSDAITRRDISQSAAPDGQLQEKRLIRQAITLTVVTALIIAFFAGLGVSKLTGRYMKTVQKNVQLWESSRTAEHYSKNEKSLVARTNYYLDRLRERFEKLPPVRRGLDFLGNVINNPEVRAGFFTTLLEHSGGIFYFTTGMVGMIISLLCNALLTIFFALLFLLKMAEFCRDDGSDKRKSEYLVRTFFNGIWLPGADENVIREACRIIEGIFFRLRVWLKGYITLILVDSTVYTTCFFFLGVPFFLPLGILAGCGIALPYLGPVISCAVTVLVTLAAGGASGNMLLAIIICYLIYNGIIEQFILYPAVIGESLGLSTLETIIVVLLGAVFAGIPGMIFALPTASVAKYIVPQIYRGLTTAKS